MVPQGASVLFGPVQTIALASRLKDPLTFTPKPNLQSGITKMRILWENMQDIIMPAFQAPNDCHFKTTEKKKKN